MGPHEMRRSLSETPDHVTRMKAFLARHPGVTWYRPVRADDSLDLPSGHRVAWEEYGTEVTAHRMDLGELVDYLEERFGAGQ